MSDKEVNQDQSQDSQNAHHAPNSSLSDRGRVKDGVLQVEISGIPAGEPMLTVPEAAEQMGVVVSKTLDQLNARKLLDVKVDGVRYIPSRFFNEDDGDVNRFLPGVIALLLDGGYREEEILDYLFTADDSLPGRPVEALHGHLAREVRRRAQAMALI